MTNEIPERFYRAVFATDLDRVLDPVASPQGRFHHTGQPALYLSETVDGVVTAIKTYLAAGHPTRVIVPLHLSARTILDARDAQTHRTLQTDPGSASMRWQDDRAAGRRPASWALSDRARATGAEGMLYASRKRPDLTHLVLFRWNEAGGARLARTGEPLVFPRG